MEDAFISLPRTDIRKLCGSGSGDAALLYLYLKAGFPPAEAAARLRLPADRVNCATTALQQLGLIDAPSVRFPVPSEPPVYSEQELMQKLGADKPFSMLVGEAQRLLGRVMTTEELKILLSMTDYLGLPTDVISILLSYCIQRSRARGNLRAPSLRTVEKEAYRWAEGGIDTLEAAAAFMQNQLELQSQVREIQALLQLSGRRLTPAEENYIRSWLEMGFGQQEIAQAYERTCLNTGSLKWQYMNKILRSWHDQGLHSLQQIQQKDQPPAARKQAKQNAPQDYAVSPLGREAIARLLAEERKEGS